ncbi:MAG: lysine--tRNA ligase [Candidatus Pelagibacterales bacterium]|jgi:lysyl-tRNA synthetase class 1|tara:strand:- start:690 stop:2258 length:1569 start_codon:yes stop_codon:yes gene_type:complete
MSRGMSSISEISKDAKAWPFIEAKKIIKKAQANNKQKIRLQTGYGPSGLPHIGTFGEVARTTMILNAIKSLSEIEVELVAFSDDMDGLRKVPDNVPNKNILEEHLHKPLTSIPDPFETSKSFGDHNNEMLQQFLDNFGFKYTFKSATELYTSGYFDEQLINVLKNYESIKNIILPTLGEERKKTYSPFLPICPESGHVLEVEIISINPDKNTITYVNKNKEVEQSILKGKCKLQWKVDWAMRWGALDIDYEMYGKDLIPTFQLSAKVSRALGYAPPENYFYELFLDQNGEKISKSKGNGLTIEEWLSYAPKETLSYFMYQNPRRAKKLFHDIIPKSSDEFLGHLNKFNTQSDQEQIENPVWHIMNGENSIGNVNVTYNLILNLVAASGKNDPAIILDFVKKYDENINSSNRQFINDLIKGAINFERDITSEQINYKTPSSEERKIFEDLINRLRSQAESADAETIQTEIYQIGKDHNFENLRDWFKLIYQVLFGKEDGPRFGTFIAIYGIKQTIELIEEKLK